jgi:hypothetical protein
MPDIAYPLIKGHLCTPNFRHNLKSVPGKPSIYEHKTMGRYKFLLSSLGESYPTTATLQGRTLYRAGGYIAWNPLAFQQVEKVVHLVGSNGGMYQYHPLKNQLTQLGFPFHIFHRVIIVSSRRFIVEQKYEAMVPGFRYMES